MSHKRPRDDPAVPEDAQAKHARERYNQSTLVMRASEFSDDRQASERLRTCMKADKKTALQQAARFVYFNSVKPGDKLSLFDGGCGAGGINFWAYDAGVHVVFGMDVSDARVQESVQVFGSLQDRIKNKSFRRRLILPMVSARGQDRDLTCSFAVGDVFSDETHKLVLSKGRFHILTYFNTLHYAASSKDKLLAQVKFWKSALYRNGIVIVQTVDSDMLKTYLKDALSSANTDDDTAVVHVSSQFFKISCDKKTVSTIETGSAYKFSFLASMEETEEYCIERNDLVDIARGEGFRLVDEYNLAQRCDVRDKLTPDEYKTLALYKTYVFRLGSNASC